jgi:hypothetical protein
LIADLYSLTNMDDRTDRQITNQAVKEAAAFSQLGAFAQKESALFDDGIGRFSSPCCGGIYQEGEET